MSVKQWLLGAATLVTLGVAGGTAAAHADTTGLLYMLGDSTAVGYNGYNDGAIPYGKWAAQDLNEDFGSSARSGTSLSSSDLSDMVTKAVSDPKFLQATDIVIGMGVNDINFGTNHPLDTAVSNYQDGIERLHNANPRARISLVEPFGDYLNGRNNDSIGNGGYSLNQLRAAIDQIGQKLGVNVIHTDLVTDDNHSQTMPDGTHPRAAVYQQLGDEVAKNIENDNVTWIGDSQSYYHNTNGYVQTSTGYLWLDNNNTYTGFKDYMGAYYYFYHGVRQQNTWESAWGHDYYLGADGRAVQGWQTINGLRYYFGDDGSFYNRPLTGYIWDGSPDNGGYRWYENGQLYTGFRFYMGAYYWFTNGVRQNNQWEHAWGYTYYVGPDGRAYQGNQNIDGQNYYFGDDGTYYLR